MSTGGNAINCSIALAKLGVPCDTIARVGRDMLGDVVVSELARHGIGTASIVRDPDASTSFTVVCITSTGERCFFHTMGADARISAADVPEAALGNRKLVFVTGTMVMETLDGPQTAQVLAAAKAAGAQTLLDTVFVESIPQSEWQRRVLPALRYCDYFIPSHPEARAITGLDDLSAIARNFQACGARNVVIKCDAQGAFCRDATGHERQVPAFRVPQVVDTTGAGDCWSAGFLVGLHHGLPMPEAARLGNAVAAHGIQAAGATAGVKPLAEIQRFAERG
jgi:sugar/nucleoside kinase (ribokinase family)